MDTKIAKFRSRADEVRTMAEKVRDADARKNIIALANMWLELAEEQERLGVSGMGCPR